MHDNISVPVVGVQIVASDSIKCLGVVLGNQMTFNKDVGHVCNSCYYHICALQHIRASMSEETAKMLACTIDGSRMDYCSALLTGMSDTNFNKLQWVQNTLASVVTGVNRCDHITPVLAKLHWLPIWARITFNIGTLVYRLRDMCQLFYLYVKLNHYTLVWILRAADMSLLAKPSPPSMSPIGRRAFSYCVVKTWNNLPADIRKATTLATFRNNLKKHLYQESFCSLFASWPIPTISSLHMTCNKYIYLFIYLYKWLR